MAASPFRRRSRAVLLGGALIAVGAAALANRNRVAGLIGARSSVPEPPPPPAPPAPSNYDLSGPAANSATPVPAADPVRPEAVDVEAEVAAAAAEAAAIGGTPAEYPSSQEPTLPAEPAEAPLIEAGQGESEGQELAERDLAAGAGSGGDRVTEIPGQTRIEELIGDQPSEEVPPVASTPETPAVGDPAERAEQQAAEERAAELEAPETQPETPETPEAQPDAAQEPRQDDDGPSWQTWSGIGNRP